MPAVNFSLLRDRRDELDLSNGELASRVSISVGYLVNILCGADEPSQRLIYRFERMLGLPKGALTAGSRTPKGDPSEPPVQPKNEPKAPPRRDEKVGTAPSRIDERAGAA